MTLNREKKLYFQSCKTDIQIGVNSLCAKDVYTPPPCTLHATTAHEFRVHQGRIYVLGC